VNSKVTSVTLIEFKGTGIFFSKAILSTKHSGRLGVDNLAKK
jgi:hypothetical protein